MSQNQEEFGYALSIDDFDKSLLPAHARTPGTDAFRLAVSRHIENDFRGFGGNVDISVDQHMIRVIWRHDANAPDPMSVIVAQLKRGEYEEAIRAMELFKLLQPADPDLLYNLGMALSDVGRLDEAEEVLIEVTELAPDHANALIALGVALARKKRHVDAVPLLRRAADLDPSNPWAHRNLGACLLQTGQNEAGISHLQRAVELSPSDQQALLGLAQAMEVTDLDKEADELYVRVIEVDSSTTFAEVAREARSRLAHESFRSGSSGAVRPDAVMYLVGAIQKFETMARDELQRIAIEIAMLGQRGFDTNLPAQQYQLKSLPGRYSGLHMVCMMYVAFKIIAPEHSVGFDLSREYNVAKSMNNPSAGDIS